MVFLNLRMLTDLFLLSFEEGTHLYPIGGFLAETYNRALRDVLACCPEDVVISAFAPAKCWGRPLDLYVQVANVLRVYKEFRTKAAVALIDAGEGTV